MLTTPGSRANRRKCNKVDMAPPSGDDLACLLRRIDSLDARMRAMEELHDEMRSARTVFDDDDIAAVAGRLRALAADRAKYCSQHTCAVDELADRLEKRRQILERVDERTGVLRKDPALMTAMSRKQASLEDHLSSKRLPVAEAPL